MVLTIATRSTMLTSTTTATPTCPTSASSNAATAATATCPIRVAETEPMIPRRTTQFGFLLACVSVAGAFAHTPVALRSASGYPDPTVTDGAPEMFNSLFFFSRLMFLAAISSAR